MKVSHRELFLKTARDCVYNCVDIFYIYLHSWCESSLNFVYLFAFFSIYLEINFKSQSVYLTKPVGLWYVLCLICHACMMYDKCVVYLSWENHMAASLVAVDVT